MLIKGVKKKMIPVMDLDYDLSCALHTPKILQDKMSMLAEHGVGKLLIVAPPPGQPDYSHAAREMPGDGPPNFLRQSRQALGGDPLELAVKYAKLSGMEVVIEFKPYEGGGNFTIPTGAAAPCGRNSLETLGGLSIGLDPFILEHPDLLVKRKPENPAAPGKVTKIEIAFVLDKIDDRSEGRKKSFGDDAITEFPAEDFEIHTSFDNGRYERDRRPFKVSQSLSVRMVKNSIEGPALPEPVRCRIIELTELSIEAPYFSVSFSGEARAFRTIPFSMSAAFNEDKRLPVTVSPTVRENISGPQLPFAETGFEFEEVGPYFVDEGWRTCTCFGFAVGKMERLRGSLCEAYPEVREHWLAQIQRFIDLGAGGVEIRLQSHSSGVTDFTHYGFNPPLVDAYLSEHRVNILQEPADPIRLMKIRGKFFETFIRQAKELLHRHERKLYLQLHAFMENPTLSISYNELGFWAHPKILPDWRSLVELADEVVLKDYHFGKYLPHLADQIKNLASNKEKPLWVHCYLQQGHDWNPDFLNALNSDPRITGILLYEVVWNDREKDGLIRVDPDGQLHWMFAETL